VQPAVRHSLRPRLVAIAPTAADAVQHAGGWLFDQVLAGWDVTVIVPELTDHTPLQILGVRPHGLEPALAYRADGSCLSAIALSAAMLDTDERIRHMVLAAVETGLPELRVWGAGDGTGTGTAAGIPTEVAQRSAPVAHRLSAAARAFKAQALAAAAIRGEEPETTEVFRRGELRRLSLAASS
jgi:hypothetical protein